LGSEPLMGSATRAATFSIVRTISKCCVAFHFLVPDSKLCLSQVCGRAENAMRHATCWAPGSSSDASFKVEFALPHPTDPYLTKFDLNVKRQLTL